MKPYPRPSHLLALFAALILLAACVTASPPPTDQPGVTIVVPPAPLAWKTYTNDELGFSFKYPALYEQEPMLDWGCGLKLQEPDEAGAGSEDHQLSLTFGSDNHLGVVPASGLSLGAYADQVVQDMSKVEYPRRDDARLSQHDPRGIVIESVIMHHGTISALFQHEDSIFVFTTRVSLACSVPEKGLYNDRVFEHVVESFRLTK